MSKRAKEIFAERQEARMVERANEAAVRLEQDLANKTKNGRSVPPHVREATRQMLARALMGREETPESKERDGR